MAVITISRQFGAGGRTLGSMVAKELDYLFLDDLLIDEISKKAKVSPNWVKSIERTAGGAMSKFISGVLSRGYMERLMGSKGYIDEEIYIELLNEVIIKFAEQDDVVIMGRGGQYILSDFKGAYHVLLVAEPESRIQFMQKYYKLNEQQAGKAVTQGEKKRTNLYKKLGKKDYDQSQLYHLTLNMSRFTIDEALKQIVTLVTGTCQL